MSLEQKCPKEEVPLYLVCNDLHVPLQSAYKSCQSTETTLMKVHNDIMLSLNGGDNVVLVLLHYTFAFDTINHNLLLSRLKKRFGIAASVLKFPSHISVIVLNLSASSNLPPLHLICSLGYHWDPSFQSQTRLSIVTN